MFTIEYHVIVAEAAHLGTNARGNTAAQIAVREARALAAELNARAFTDY